MTGRKNENLSDKNDHMVSRELLHSLDRELQKEPGEVDVKKTKEMLDLLETLEVPGKKLDIDADTFAENLRKEHGIKVKPIKQKKKLSYRIMRVACAVMIFCAAFLALDWVTAEAFDFSLIRWVKNTAQSFEFEFKGRRLEQEYEKESDDSRNDDPNVREYMAEKIEDISQVSDRLGSFYAADEEKYHLETKEMYYNELDNSLDITYVDAENYYVGLNISSAMGEGSMSMSVADNRIIDEKQIGNFDVTICQTEEEDLTAGIFIYDDVLYVIDTTRDVDFLEKLIGDMMLRE